MPLHVHSLCAYLLSGQYPNEGQHFDATKFIKALKTDVIKGYGWVPVRGTKRRLSQVNRDDAIQWFGQMAADYLRKEFGDDRIRLVPIPNSSFTVGSKGSPRTALMAEAVAANGEGRITAHDILRWKENLGSARRGEGPRAPAVLYNNLVLVGDVLQDADVILIDDSIVTCGHMQACAAFLRMHGAAVAMGVCGGRTVQEPVADAFSPIDIDIDDFES